MPLQNKKKLQWQCRRGMLELELFLNDFLEFDYDKLSEEQKYSFEDLLTVIDPVLFDYFMGIQESDNAKRREIIKIIRKATLQRS
ncbi:MAG: succinate dehydrogenase assembly factor 2 [Thiotrichaceae bacterium]|nr:succinate dehydrogenase assembly factor 2 [Thiotrichaceae bacterium]